MHERLKRARKARFGNASDFARRLGLVPASVYRIEKGDVVPSVETLTKWAELTGVSTDYLVGLSHKPKAAA